MKKFLSILLALLTLGFATAPVSAQTVWDGTADVTWYDATQTSFDISTPEQLAGVAQLVNNSTTTFSGMTLNLTADIYLNSTGDSTNNWVPIGGYATATGEQASSGNAFQGVFNAHGHTIYNLYCEKQSYFHAGLFGCIKNPCTIDSLVMVNPVVKSQGMMGAIAGMSRSGGAIYIRYCLVINGRLQGGSGNNIGFMVGANYPNSSGTYIQNCGATGTISGNYVGGLGGNSQYDNFTNCYFAGAIYGSPSGGIAAYDGSINNCYSYVSTSVSGGNNGTSATQAEMQDPQMIVNLGDAFKMDNGINNGYPVMSYMSGVDPIEASICQGESITITAFGFDTYAWSNGATTESITVQPSTTTTYSVTCTSNGVSTTLTSTITVFPQAEITALVVPGSDGQTHATLNQSTFTVGCGSSDNITLVVTPETNYRVSRVTLNGTEIYGDTFGEGTANITINPGGTLGEVKVFLSNEYTISITELLDTGDTLHVSSLVQPYGSNGVFTATAGNDQTFAFNNTARYYLQDVEIDGAPQGVVTSYDFVNIHENHSIVVTYVDSCGIHSLPFFEDFESAAASTVPECYEAFQSYSYPSITESVGNSHSGTKNMYAYMYGSSYDYCFVLPKITDTITYPLSELMVSFWGKAGTMANSFTVGVMSDPTNYSTFTAVQTLPATSIDYAEYTAYLGNAGQGNEYIAIRYNCGTSYSYACIDDITVDFAPMCSPVSNLQASNIFGTNATLTWSPTTVGEVSEYNIYVYDMVNETEATYTSTETSYIITGLNELTPYHVGVYTSCTNGQTSDTTFINFMTPCNSPVHVQVGDGTSTTNYYPTYSCYNYSYTQQIFAASEIGSDPAEFNSLYFQCTNVVSGIRTLDIYAALIPSNMTLSDGWILPSATIPFQLLRTGAVTISSSGTDNWFEIQLDTVLVYNGTDNILLSVLDHTGSYVCSNAYRYHSAGSGMCRYAYRDGSTYDYTNPDASGYSSSNVNNIRFGYCDQSTCIRPNTLTASNVTENTADIDWVPAGNENSWELEYMADSDTDWTSAGEFNATSITLTGLESNTNYTIRVRSVCSSSDYSIWSETASFRTQCDAITTLPYSTSFEDASGSYVYCWSRLASDASHMVYRYNDSPYAHSGSNSLDFAYTPGCWTIAIMPAFDASIPTNSLMLDFWLDKTGTSGYFEVGVMTDPEDASTFEVVDTIESTLIGNSAAYYEHIIMSLEDYTGNGQYVAFRASNAVQCGYRMDDLMVSEIPTCMYPTNFQALSSTNSSVMLSWTEMGDATSWNILYDTTGFDPELGGITVIADATPFEVTGLMDVTTYDFYLQADCGGMQSQWVGPVTKTTGTYTFGVSGSDTLTTCSVILYDDGGVDGNYSNDCNYTLVIYPATAGSGFSISGTVNTYNSTSTYYQGVLTIYEGVGTTGSVLGTYMGEQNVNLAFGGPVTLSFTSGPYSATYYARPGFNLLVQCTECFPPSNVVVSNPTLDGATVTWSGNASEYAVYLSGAMTGYYTTTDTTYSFTGLNSSSTYSVQVRSLCGTDSSLLSSTAHFNTICAAITVTADVPWFEDFESYAGGGEQPFVCWETPVSTPGGGPFVYCGYAQSAHSGANTAELKGNTNLLVLPEFTNNIHDLRLTFWATYYGSGTSAQVGVVTDVNDPNSFELLGDAGTPGPRGSANGGNGNFMGPFDFNSVQATSGRIAILFTGSGTSSGWNLDDFTVSLAPNCPSPVKTSVQATNVDGHNATITFTDNDPSHNSWTVYYKLHSDSVWSNEVTSTTSLTLTNLDPETTYDVYVVTNCTTPAAEEDATLTISFSTTVACPAPQNLSVSNIGMTSATVTWFSNASSCTVEYGPAGFTPGSGTTATVTTSTYDLTGLTSGTSYTVYVTADCGGTDGTSAAASANFSTNLCEVADQCTYTFNLADSYGDGWNGGYITVQQNNITVATVGMTSGATATETITLCDNQSTSLIWNTGSWDSEASFTVTDASGNQVYATSGTPSGTLTTFTTNCGGSGPVLADPTVATQSATAITQTSATLNGTITNPDNVTITAKGFEWKATSGGTYTPVTVTGNALTYNLDNLTPNTGYTYKAFITFNGATVYGNEVTFTTLEQTQLTEPSATTQAASGVTQTTATLNGTISNPDNVAITAQGFEWKQASASSYTIVNATGATMTYPLSGLTANTDYTYRAFVTTANGTHYGADVNFTTLEEQVEPCDVPTGLTATDIQNESITIAWDANANVTSWNIQYKPVGGQLSSAASNTNSYTITGLTGHTDYEIQVQAVCASGTSDWCTAITVQTTDVGIENWLSNSVSLYPNPAKEYVDIRINGDVNVTMMEVYDVYGKLLNTVNVLDNPTRVNVSGLADGMYFVRVTTEQGAVTKSFLKR